MARINPLWTLAQRALLVLLIAAPAAAQIPCEDDPFGELPDCSFEQDPLADWTLVDGSFFGPTLGDGDDAHRTGSGSAEVHAAEAGPDFYSSVVSSECFEVTPAWQSSYGAWVRLIEGVELVDCYVERFAYADSTCSNLLGSSAASLTNANPLGWTESAGTGELTGPFARLEINCSSTDAFEIKIDDAFSVRPESCSDDPTNVVRNCSFEYRDPPAGWLITKATSFGPSTEPAQIGNGSGALVSAGEGGHGASVGYCFSVPAAGMRATYGASYRLLNGSINACNTFLLWYDEPGCTGASGGAEGPSAVPNAGGWSQSAGIVSDIAGVSAQLVLDCIGGESFTVQVDETFVLLDTPIFSDGFETGNTSSWTTP